MILKKMYLSVYISDSGKDDSEDSESSSEEEENASDTPKKTSPKKDDDEVSKKLSNLTVSEQDKKIENDDSAKK